MKGRDETGTAEGEQEQKVRGEKRAWCGYGEARETRDEAEGREGGEGRG